MTQVTVLMAIKDSMPYLPEAVESILGQTLRTFDFIVVDDGSQDGSFEYLQSLKDDRIRCVRNKGQGQTAALNMGMVLSQSDWIARMDGDDWSFPERLEKQMALAERSSDASLISCDYLLCDTSMNPVAPIHLATPGEALYRYLRNKNNPLCHPSVLFKRLDALSVGGYDESIKNAQDYDLWLKLLKKGRLAHVPEILLKYRVVPSSLSILRQPEQTREREAILSGSIPNHPATKQPASFANLRQRNGMYAYRLGFGAWLAGKRLLCVRYILKSLISGIRPLRCLAALATLLFPRPFYLRLCGYAGVYR